MHRLIHLLANCSHNKNFAYKLAGSNISKREVDKNCSNYQDTLRACAVVLMVIDHLGFYFLPRLEFLRALGRFSMPIFCFFSGYNFKGSSKIRILLYGLLLALFTYPFSGGHELNMLISIYLGQIYLQRIYAYTTDFVSNLFQFLPILVLTPISQKLFDFGTLAFIFMAIGFIVRHNPNDSKKYIFMLAFLTLVNAQIVFWFNCYNFWVVTILCILIYLLLSKGSFENIENKSNILRTLSRNSLQIYFYHIFLFEVIWFSVGV